MAGLQMLIVVLEIIKYKSAHCCQIHEYTHLSTRLECNICKLKLHTKILTNLSWTTFSIWNFKAEELWYCFYWAPNTLNMPHRTSVPNKYTTWSNCLWLMKKLFKWIIIIIYLCIFEVVTTDIGKQNWYFIMPKQTLPMRGTVLGYTAISLSKGTHFWVYWHRSCRAQNQNLLLTYLAIKDRIFGLSEPFPPFSLQNKLIQPKVLAALRI